MNTAVNEYNYRFKLTDYSLFDRNRARKVAIYGRVSTEHEAQLSALENQLQWYDDQVKYHPNWTVCERYIDEAVIIGLKPPSTNGRRFSPISITGHFPI